MSKLLVNLAALIIILAGVRASQDIVIPFLFAMFFAILLASPFRWLQSRGVGTPIALTLVLVGMSAVTIVGIYMTGRPLLQFLQDQGQFQERLNSRFEELRTWIKDHGIPITSIDEDAALLQPDWIWRLFDDLLEGIYSAFSNGLLILIIVTFVLLEAAGFPRKIRAMEGDSERSLAEFATIIQNVRRYMAIKTWVSLLTGVTVYLWLLLFRVDGAILWAVMAFLLNYIPNVGSILAAVPAVLVSLISDGILPALGVTLGYLIVNGVVGYLIEPRMMGRGLGLSTLVVILSLIFWGWLLGSAGLLLSVPLTMVVKIALATNPETQWIAILLGDDDIPESTEQSSVDLPIAETDAGS